jgi:hypothetical protein
MSEVGVLCDNGGDYGDLPTVQGVDEDILGCSHMNLSMEVN